MILNFRTSSGLFPLGRAGRTDIQTVFSYFFLFLLIAVLITEGYAAFVLKEKLETQARELNRISMHLQTLKGERDTLKEEFSSYNKAKGEKHDGTSP